jgi:hypothetical protein
MLIEVRWRLAGFLRRLAWRITPKISAIQRRPAHR